MTLRIELIPFASTLILVEFGGSYGNSSPATSVPCGVDAAPGGKRIFDEIGNFLWFLWNICGTSAAGVACRRARQQPFRFDLLDPPQAVTAT
jgi:hypothetical protein